MIHPANVRRQAEAGHASIPCPSCGERFQQTNDRLAYCSRPCRDAARRLVGPPKPAAPYVPIAPRARDCRVCGATFLSKRAAVMCSDACRREYASRQRRENYVPMLPRTAACATCGQSFTQQGRGGRRVYCSSACEHRSPTYRAMRAGHRHRRRVRLAGGPSSGDRFRREDIFARDGWRCHLCGRKVRRDVPATHDMAPTIDHLVPVAARGAHEARNVATAHFICNALRRDTGPAQLRLLA